MNRHEVEAGPLCFLDQTHPILRLEHVARPGRSLATPRGAIRPHRGPRPGMAAPRRRRGSTPTHTASAWMTALVRLAGAGEEVCW